MRPLSASLALLVLLALLPAPASATTLVELDLQDPPEDVIVDPRSGPNFNGARPAVDILRVTQRMDGSDVVLSLHFAGAVGEPDAVLSVMGTAARGVGLRDQVMFGGRFDAEGNPPAPTAAEGIIGGEVARVNITFEVEGSALVSRISGLPASAPCFAPHTITFGVRTRDAEYTDWFYPSVSPCDENDLLDGAAGPCPPSATPPADRVAATLDDPRGDVRATDASGREGDVVPDAGGHDVTQVTSRREGDRIVQSVTFAAPPLNASRELRLEVVNRVSGGQDRDLDPKDALVVRYWRFANASQADRVEGERVTPDAVQDKVRFAVESRFEGNTITLSWCASLVPQNARCFGIAVEARQSQMFSVGVVDVARPAVDPCLSAAPPRATTTTTTTTPADDFVDEEPIDEEPEEGGNDAPGFGVLALVAALAVALLVRRRAA